MSNAQIILSEYQDYLDSPLEFLDSLSAQGKVHYLEIYPGMFGWVVTDYAIAKEILKDPRFCRDSLKLQKILGSHGYALWNEDDQQRTDQNMLNSDPPDHSRLRRLAVKPFTPGSLNARAPRIREITRSLLEHIPVGVEVDVISQLAYPLPMTVISEMLGLPEGKERDNLRQWTSDFLTFPSIEVVENATKNMFSYLSDLVERRRATDIPPNSINLLDQLITARDEGDKLTDVELISTIAFLLMAGHETTVSLIGNMAMELGSSPEIQAQLRDDARLIPLFVEETMRNNGPVHLSMFRFVTEDTQLGGVDFKANDIVIISFLAANRDPKVFSEPEKFKLHREDEPKHMGFGYGIHTCLGAGLARLEGVIAVEELLNHFSNMVLAEKAHSIPWRISNIARGKTHVPMIFSQ